MAEFDKWLTKVGPDASAAEVARRAIKQRVRAVKYYLKQIQGPGLANRELVHQLRVWSRRASAALRMFDELLPGRKAKKLRRTLGKLRRLGGDARDCDLLLLSLAHEPTTPETIALARRLRKRRKMAQRPLERARRKLIGRGKLQRQLKKVLAGIRYPSRSTRRDRTPQMPRFRSLAAQQLEPMVAELFAFDASDLEQNDRLHELRIVGKRLRYAAELGVAALPRIATGGLYDQLVQLQDRLGIAVDHLAQCDRLGALEADAPAGDRPYLKEAMREHQHQFAAQKRKFLRWWTPARRRAMERRWRGVLRSE